MIKLIPNMKTQYLWLAAFLTAFPKNSSAYSTKEIVNFFKSKDVKFINGFLCNQREIVKLTKRFGKEFMPTVFLNTENVNESLGLHERPTQKSGVVLNMKCPKSDQILGIASKLKFFDITRYWLIITEHHFTQQEFEEISLTFEPKKFDVLNYLEFGTASMKHGRRIMELNLSTNDDIINNPEFNIMIQQNPPENVYFNDSKKMQDLVNLKALVNSEVTLAVPEAAGNEYDLYEIHRKTIFTRMVIEHIGKMNQIGRFNVAIASAVLKRKDFNGTLLRATAGLLYFSYYSKSDELQPFTFDRWAIKDTQITVLAAQRLNYRIVIKLFDDHGWGKVDGKYTGMLRYFEEDETDMTAGGLLMVDARFDAVTWVNSIFKVRLGLIFKQPSLSQVANIFALPFSPGVWLTVFALLMTTALILYSQLNIIKKLDNSVSKVKFTEVFTFLTGAACQQGTDLTTKIASARVTMLVFLIASLFLFTSYTANIVSLLQSSSDSIKTVQNFLDSSLAMGVENLPFQINLVEQDNDPLVRKLYKKKLKQKVVKGKAYMDPNEGIQKVRNELYAFHTETETGARIISATFTETEKRQIKTIPLFPLKLNGHSVVKKSPFYEILAEAYHWCNEVGFVSRADRRYGYVIPKTSGHIGGGFNSIGLNDMRNVFMMLGYGMLTALCFLFVENLMSRFHRKSVKHWYKL